MGRLQKSYDRTQSLSPISATSFIIIFLPPHRLLGNAAYGRLLYQRCALRMRYALGGLQYIMLNQNQWHLASAGSLPDYKLYRRDRGPFVYLVADAVSH